MVWATINGKVIDVFVSWYFPRSTMSVHLKRKGKAVPFTSSVSSQYLGSLKALEDKSMQEKSPEYNKVDNLRAAVFQVDFKNEQTNKQNCAYVQGSWYRGQHLIFSWNRYFLLYSLHWLTGTVILLFCCLFLIWTKSSMKGI